ncbi:HEAT repeat domain-containing protein [Gaetbulibacter aestuarii]|uniref:HEAT repeat domain-containing protein n=1 Tax=Gaetbulibacter aestuarii TaxID=1502358 RepID=A0ABW7MW43_9FLAO
MMEPQNILTAYKNFPHLIQITWGTTAVLIIAIVILTINLKFWRAAKRKKEANQQKAQAKFESLILEYLYSQNDNPNYLSTKQLVIIDAFAHPIKVKWKRRIIVKILYNLLSEVSGEMSDIIKKFYFRTGLYKYALFKLKSKKWEVIGKGIEQLTRFKIIEAHQRVKPFLNHPRDEVRKEAHIYMVSLFGFEGLSFLNTIEEPMSEWAQIEILETLQEIESQEFCDIKLWLKSNNRSVVLFALKLAKIYNQFEVNETLMELLSHPDKDIRVQTIEVLTHLYGIEAKEMLKANFNDLSLEEQISFFKLLEKLVMPNDEPFVEKHLFHKNFEIQLLALKILKSINLDKFLHIKEDTEKSSNSDILEYVNNL